LHVLDGNEHEPFIRDSGNVVDAILDFVAGRPLSDARRLRSVPPKAPLSGREREVLQLLASGEANKAIARQLGIAVATVERHVGNIYRKLGARGRADAALAAVALGLVDVPTS
jgi:DNA-binding NarL/FixJ family response regulator